MIKALICSDIECRYYDELYDMNCNANEDLCEICLSSNTKSKNKMIKALIKWNGDNIGEIKNFLGNLFVCRNFDCSITVKTLEGSSKVNINDFIINYDSKHYEVVKGWSERWSQITTLFNEAIEKRGNNEKN